MERNKVMGGAVLLLLSSVVLFVAATAELSLLTGAALVLGALGLAAGSLLLGTSEGSRPV